MIGVLLVNLIYVFGFFHWVADFSAPVIEKIWGLPREAVFAIAVGFLRKDVAVGMLNQLPLSVSQLIVGCVVLAMTFPCIASFVMIFKDLGLKILLLATLIMLTITVIVGGVVNLTLGVML